MIKSKGDVDMVRKQRVEQMAAQQQAMATAQGAETLKVGSEAMQNMKEEPA
jgi:hypothetical protein